MVLKNKDGSIYSLRKPINNNQKMWSDPIKLHNFKWEPENIKKEEVKPIAIPPKPIITEEVKEEIPIIIATEQLIPKNLLIVHCLPVIEKKINDVLYDEEITKLMFGDKILIEAKLLEIGAFGIKLLVNESLMNGSILYPAKYADGRSFSDFRWWKVRSCQEHEDKYIINGNLSDYQPDFS